MKKHLYKILPLLVLLLVSCNEDSFSETQDSLVSSEITAVTSDTHDSLESSENTADTSETLSDERILNFYAMNDFHGAIFETDDEPGIFKVSSYLKSKFTENPNGSIHLNSGDLWQGSIESNMNRGAFLTKAMNELSLDAFVLGNHEFDWYDTAIMNNKEIADYPFLGANIIDKRTGNIASNLVHYDDTFQASHIVEKNGVNVGIIGTIGSDLESSILGLAIADYSFEPVTNYVISEALNLREQGADIIALVTHDSLLNFSMSSTRNEYYEIFDGQYVDLVFSGHQHRLDDRVINGIPVMQSWAYGGGIMELELSYNVKTKEKLFIRQEVVNSWDVKVYDEDEAMTLLFAPYEAEIETTKNEVIGTLNGHITKEGLLNLANKVIYDYGIQEELNDIVALHNRAGVRLNEGIPSGEVIFGDVYRAFPFDNELMIIPNISGSDLNRLISGDYKGYPAKGSGYDTSKTYTLLTLDFISYREGALTLNMEQISTKIYIRDLIREYFLAQNIVNAEYFNYY